ncbi:MAG: AAA family ATPase, partial [Nanoarchaeota archaeon]
LGSTLLSGDIGSGKTSILMAIEFALFGLQPGQKGISLLRNNESQGRVEIEFEVEGNNTIIERTIKKSKNITQDYCSIETNGFRQEISVTELKNKVLEILSYPTEFAKKQNFLYKFTIYTPQESMKQIILEDSETRLDILRHVFGIDKYRQILENSSTFTAKLRDEQRRREGFVYDLESKKEFLLKKEDELEDKHKILDSINRELVAKIDIRKKIQEEIKAIKEKIDEKRKYEKEIEKTTILLASKKETISSNIKEIKNIEEQISLLFSSEFSEEKLKTAEIEMIRAKIDKEEMQKNNLIIASEIHSLNSKITDFLEIKNKISVIDLCPTCLQSVDSNYKANVFNKIDSEINSNSNKMTEFNEKKRVNDENLKKINSEIINLENKISGLRTIKIKLESLNEKQKRMELLKHANSQTEKDEDILLKHIESLKNLVSEFSRYDSVFNEKDKLLQTALKEEQHTEIKVAEIKKEIDLFEKQCEDLKKEIFKKEEIKREIENLKEIETWISNNFVPLISFIEKNVMAKLRDEFSSLFSRWFSMLVSDNLDVHLDESFTPIIEQQDYEIEYSYLSGGERTAIALAYRLALNQVINSLLSRIKTKDIIILDEPTDGFSDQQLDKMRDVFQQINVQQLILVSHEQKIEGFVDNIIKISKNKGESSVGS